METFRARTVDIRSPKVQPRELDGDVIAPAKSLSVHVREKALTVCVAKDAPTDAPTHAPDGQGTDLTR
jgi:hypothetical protein